MYKVPMCKPASAANLFANHWTKRFVLFGNQNWKDLAKTELCRETFILDQVTQFSVEFPCNKKKKSVSGKFRKYLLGKGGRHCEPSEPF